MTEKVPDDSWTLGEVKAWLHDRIEKGTVCPACERFAHYYEWELYSTAVRALIDFYRLGDNGSRFVHVDELKARGHKGQGDVNRLRAWDLVEEKPVKRGDGGRAGWWRTTALADDWLHGRITVPKHTLHYNRRKIDGPYGPPVTAQDQLGKLFDLRKLMGWHDL